MWGLLVVLALAFGGDALAQEGSPNSGDSPQPIPQAGAQVWSTRQLPDGFTVWRKNIGSACISADHNYTLDVPEDPAQMSDIQYTMSNFDVDYQGACSMGGGGEVDVMYWNDERLGILTGANDSYSINAWPLEQSQVISGSNRIRIDTDATETGCWCVGVEWVEVKARLKFEVFDVTPTRNEIHRDFRSGKVNITAQFSRPHDFASATADAFFVEYRDQNGAWQRVAGDVGTVVPAAQNRIRFTPDADLKGGVRYRVTVRGGASGVKSATGVELERDTVWYFTTVPDLEKVDAFDSGSGSACGPSVSPCPGLELAIFQSVRNGTILVRKPSLARVYLRWQKHPDVLPADQVTHMFVDVYFAPNDGSFSRSLRGQWVERQDQYSPADQAAARHTVQLDFTPPTAESDYFVQITPQPQKNAVPVVFEHRLAVDVIDPAQYQAKILKFDHYFFKDGDYANGVPAADQSGYLNTWLGGNKLTTRQFPVLGTFMLNKGEISIGYQVLNSTNSTCGGASRDVWCPYPRGGKIRPEHMCIIDHMNVLRGGDEFLVASVSPSACPGPRGMHHAQAHVILNFQGALDSITHELGHEYTLPDTGPTDSFPEDVEGFDIRENINYSYAENQPNVVPLMRSGGGAPSGFWRWITRTDYEQVTDVLYPLPPPPRSQTARSSTAVRSLNDGTFYIVSALVDRPAKSADLIAAFHQAVANDPLGTSGPCEFQLLDSSGGVLVRSFVDPAASIEDPGTSEGLRTAAQNDGPRLVSASFPWNNDAVTLRLLCDGEVLLTHQRTFNAPQVDFVDVADGATLSGTRTIAWTGSDADPDILSYQLQINSRDGRGWRPLSLWTNQTSATVDTSLLPSGTDHLLQIVISDGFNLHFATRTVRVANPPRLTGTLPADGAKSVPTHGLIEAIFVSQMEKDSLKDGGFRLQDDSRQAIPGKVDYDWETRTASFQPDAPLAPGRTYTAHLAATVQDTNGNLLGSPQSWQFTTAADGAPASVAATLPASGEADVPTDTTLWAIFSEALDPATVSGGSAELLDSAGAPVPVAVSYRAEERAIVLAPQAPLSPHSDYRARILAGVADAAGNPLGHPIEWHFRTGEGPAPGLRVVQISDALADPNNSGLYRELALSVYVAVPTAGTYNLNGRLLDRDGKLVVWATSGDVALAAGVQRLVLPFDSSVIRGHGLDGPFTLDALHFYDKSAPQTNFLFLRDVYRTRAYPVDQLFSVISLQRLPDQLLEVNTSRENAFNLRQLTSHFTRPVSDVTYSVFVSSHPAVTVSIDPDTNVDIAVEPDTEAVSDVRIEAKDPDGFTVRASFQVRVERAKAARLLPSFQPSQPPDSSQSIRVAVQDQWGRAFLTPVAVQAETTAGTVAPAKVQSSDGVATFTLQAGSAPAQADVAFSAGDATQLIRVRLGVWQLFLPSLVRSP